MNVLIIGSGGRESAFAHAIKKSNLLTTLFVAPGNGGTAKIAENVNLQENDFEGISNFCKQNKIELLFFHFQCIVETTKKLIGRTNKKFK